MRLHVIGLPHTETLSDYNQCAYTAKVRKFATMMHRRGHEVFLYSAGDNEAECTEHIPVLSRAEQIDLFKQEDWWIKGEWFGVDWDESLPYWRRFNANVCHELHARIEERDIICLITGYPQRSIIDCFPKHMSVEYGIGYEGVYAPYRCYESYAWMHCLYGKTGPSSTDGRFYDAVIPNFFDVDEFPERVKPICGDEDSYYLFMSRMTPRKGYEIAIELTRRIGVDLIIAGTGGDRPEYDHVKYVGYADTAYRGELLANATALLCPTLYLEPFGGVVVESMLCGTPVLTTDWGAFTETVRQGIDGYRCRNMSEFVIATQKLDYLDPEWIRLNARDKWSLEAVGAKYDEYFERLQTLWGAGFYA
jgi:glycosyltransferase involved in cell wall biosynthesis